MKKELNEALEIALDSVCQTAGDEYVSIFEALNRVLSRDLYCIKELPSFSNSAMDGYAIKKADIDEKISVKGSILAGDSVENLLVESKECYKIMTGAPLPNGADFVVPIEYIKEIDEQIEIEKYDGKDNIREKGSESKEGALLIKKGTILNSGSLAILASQGISFVSVKKRLKIGILSSGDEIREPWERALEYQIYNTNSITIYSLLKSSGYEPSYIRLNSDSFEEVKNSFINEAQNYDMLITTGGASVGDRDYISSALKEIDADVLFDAINIKPGKVTKLSIYKKTPILSLPGNPLSAYMNLVIFGLSVLRRLTGAIDYKIKYINTKMGEDLKLKGDRSNIILGSFKEGSFYPFNSNLYGSGMIMPFAECAYFASFDKNLKEIKKGEVIRVVDINSLFGGNGDFINF